MQKLSNNDKNEEPRCRKGKKVLPKAKVLKTTQSQKKVVGGMTFRCGKTDMASICLCS